MLSFHIHPVNASGTIYIRADGSIDPPTAPISTFDNITYTLTGNVIGDADGIIVERNNIVIDGAGYTVQGSWAGGTGVDLAGRSNVTIKDTNIEASGYGLYLNSTVDSVISGNNITYNYDGFILDSSSNYNSITGNNITANSGDGLRLGYSSNHNNISGNNITNNGGGIWLYSSSNYNSITGNDITNTEYGIVLDSSSDYNSIAGNNITANNWNGIRLNFASNNKFCHNNFIGNTEQVHTIVTPAYANVWDDGYPSGGNYWSGYGGTDANYDGIGDSNYTIDADNNDRYPLMGTFREFNATPKQHVQTICNSKISDFNFSGTAISFNVSGENDTAGFCRICVPTALMNVTYKVFVNGTEVSYNLLPCSNETYSYLYFNYTHSTQEVIIVPEFPTFLILSLFMIATLLAVKVHKRKRPKSSRE
jgi:parallel beta-helix repeat protein